ncbi:tetratricopeptide repeat protein [Paenibacillus amylolyticus]|uniref:tetratricopeptide repeat protein n=1 Tax=Paenibacillus amylolyticus TaxID=1451 RepID=UPI003D2D2E4F
MDQLISEILTNTSSQPFIDPPVETKIQELPFSKLTWENFEKLCLKLILLDSDILHCQQYGNRGQEQSGIDLYAYEKSENSYKVYQCKKVKKLGSGKIKEAVNKFLENEWAGKAHCFVLCTSESMTSKARADEIAIQRDKLTNMNIEFQIWDSNKLSIMLKKIPSLVEDFFGIKWVDSFCTISSEIITKSNNNTYSPSIINNIFFRFNKFKGRNDELKIIRNKLLECGKVFITGMPGIGKTQLAVQYLTLFKKHYQTICWIRSESSGTLKEDLYIFMKEIDKEFDSLGIINDDSVLGYVRNWMEQNRNYLIVFDNVKSQRELRLLLPSTCSGHLIVTSQDEFVEDTKTHLSLKSLSKDESMELLIQMSGREKDSHALKITDYFGDLPLSIVHVGSFIRNSNKTFEQVHDLLLNRPIDVKKRIGSIVSTDKSFENLIEIILDELVNIEPNCLDFLILLSFLSSDYISLEWFDRQTEIPQLISIFEDELLYYDVRSALLRYSFINEQVQGNVLNIHRLLQSTIRERLTFEEKKNWYMQMTELFNRLMQKGDLSHIEYRKKGDLVNHIKTLAAHYETNMKNRDFLTLLNNTSNYLREVARYSEAFTLLEFVWGEYELHPEVDEVSKATVLMNMGLALKNQNKYSEASSYYNQAISVLRKNSYHDSFQYAICLMNSGRLDMDLGYYEESFDKLKLSLELVDRLIPEDNIEKVHFLNNYGLILQQNNKSGAYKYYIKAWRVLKLFCQLDTPKAALIYNNLSVILMKRKKTKWAILSLQKSLDIDMRFFGDKHPVLAYRYQNLADAYLRSGFHCKALQNYKMAYKIRRKYFDLDHPDIGILFLKYGYVLLERKRYAEGKEWILRSLRVDELFFKDPLHPQLEPALETLAYIQINLVNNLLNQSNRDIQQIRLLCKQGEKYIVRALKIKYSEEKITCLEEFKKILKAIHKGRIKSNMDVDISFTSPYGFGDYLRFISKNLYIRLDGEGGIFHK